MNWSLWLCAWMFGLFVTEDDVTGGVTCWSLSSGMQSFEKGDQCSGFRWTQILSIGGHVSASLDHLSNQLILREPYGNTVERRTSLSAEFTERMAIAALLHLKDERALPLESSSTV